MRHYTERPTLGKRRFKYWCGTVWCFLAGHYWVQLFCTRDERLHEWCPRCEEWRA